MKLGTILLGGVALGAAIGVGVFSWRASPKVGFIDTPELSRARQDVVTDPDDADAWIRVGDEARHAGDVATARLAYARVIDLRPDRPEGHARLGILLVDLGEVDAARGHLGRAADRGSDDARFVLAGLPAVQ